MNISVKIELNLFIKRLLKVRLIFFSLYDIYVKYKNYLIKKYNDVLLIVKKKIMTDKNYFELNY